MPPSRSSVSGSRMADNPEEYLSMLFEVCRLEDGTGCVKKLLEEINRTGIRRTDPRLRSMVNCLEHLKPGTIQNIEDMSLDPQTFKSVISENIVLINKASQNQMIIPAFQTFCESIAEIYESCKENYEGNVADTIPQLAGKNKDSWGLSICTVDGQRFSLGNAKDAFSIQGISKPITYAVTMSELGEEIVHHYQGREPSGRKMNEIVLDYNNKPHNPLINSGALVSASLILQKVKPELKDMAQKFDFLFQLIERMCGYEFLEFNNSVFLAERTSVDRDIALAYFMRENKCFPPGADIKNIIEFYFQTCALEMNCESGSLVAATLANGGTCPITGEKILSDLAITNTLSLMYSCGMSIYSGQFAFKCGLPAMTSISGALMLVIPEVMGICLWSPPLDKLNNSERGVQFCNELIDRYAFHKFDGIGCIHEKLDPSLKRMTSTNDMLIQVLLACALGDILFLERAYLQDFDLELADYDGRTPLHIASAEGHMDCIKFLCEIAGVKPNAQDRWEQTPISEAIRFNHLQVVKYLDEFIEKYPNQGLEPVDHNEESSSDDERPLSVKNAIEKFNKSFQ